MFINYRKEQNIFYRLKVKSKRNQLQFNLFVKLKEYLFSFTTKTQIFLTIFFLRIF